EWIYNWRGDGMLNKVTRPDKKDVYFEYDALGRRTAKIFDGKITRWVWDENIPLHEWSYDITERPKIVITELGLLELDKQEPITNLLTWIFDEGTAKPAAKITNDQSYSIITDYLGTPVEAYDQRGEKVWSCELNAYGKINKMEGLGSFIPFRYQGQYADEETGLFYNRFRYFSPQDDCYLTQDPIGIKGGLRLYGYVHDPNWWLDIFGLTGTYYFTDGNTSYIGKGPKDRFYTSMKGRVNGSGNVTQGVHHDFGSNDVGLMVEAELMDRHNAVTDPNFHNAINSPGKKMLDDLKINNPTAHADIIKKANDIQADFNAANGIVCK
ncbi:MAG TPA: RHS repeat-associated core domain-containing protein, partial [Bacteroidia bacterium]|nr:RHS repeat-associated core domain-containing protein [Bacteroidia bacterium]